MAYLVTGGTGFIGSYVVRDIVREGERVVVYDLFPERSVFERLLSEEERARIKIVRGDVADLAYLLHTIKENNVDRIIHMAALLTAGAVANPPLALKVNSEGTINVFEAARLLGLKKVFWASSISVFGFSQKYAYECIANDAPHRPSDIYGACKSFNENAADFYFERYGLDISAIRYGHPYGVGMQEGIHGTANLIRELIENPVWGKPGKVPFADNVMNWLYVDDAARATLLGTKIPRTKTRAFNISGDVRSLREITDYIRKLVPGADITLLPGSRGSPCRFETKPIEEELGFRPQWSVERGIKEILNTARRQRGLPPV